MRFLKLQCIALMSTLVSVAFFSCNKDSRLSQPIPEEKTPSPQVNSDEPPKTVTGFWTGKYSAFEKSVPLELIFNVKISGSLEVLNIGEKIIGIGSWSMMANNFKAIFIMNSSGKQYFFDGELIKSDQRLSGTWGFEGSYINGGSWQMTK